MRQQREKNVWQELRRKEKFLNAARGFHILWLTTPNLLIHVTVSLLAIVLGFIFHISSFEWIALIFCIGFVLVAEAFNTAIEIDIDLTSPEYHPYARDTKDVAAAAVLLSAITAIVVGVIIFLPKIL